VHKERKTMPRELCCCQLTSCPTEHAHCALRGASGGVTCFSGVWRVGLVIPFVTMGTPLCMHVQPFHGSCRNLKVRRFHSAESFWWSASKGAAAMPCSGRGAAQGNKGALQVTWLPVTWSSSAPLSFVVPGLHVCTFYGGKECTRQLSAG
jgi:hypothetical protein